MDGRGMEGSGMKEKRNGGEETEMKRRGRE